MPAPERVLVKATNWLGDLVMSLPALAAVRRAYPASRLAVLVRRDLASFFDGTAWIDDVIPYAVSPGLGRVVGLPAVVRDIRARRFDLAVLFPSSFEAALWPFLARVPARVGYAGDGRAPLLTATTAPTPEVARGHEVGWYLHLLRATLGIEGSADPVAPGVEAGARARVAAWLAARRRRPEARLLALAPAAAYGPAKEWPAARYAALADLLAERHGAECVLVGAPSERRRCEEVSAASRTGVLVAAGETTVGELIALLATCDAFAGNDSGAMHVADALGRPTVGIYGSTAPERTGPRGARARILREPIACSPCLARTCRFGHYACFEPIAAEQVAATLADLGAVS
jgi:lipopolysaccharide heptosyltransferase II